LLLGIIVYSFWDFLIASIIFMVIVGVLEIWIVGMQCWINKAKIKIDQWDDDEMKIMKKYYLFFQYPFMAKMLSSSLSMIQLSAFIWVPWLCYNGFWIPAFLIGINYFIAGLLAARLNPRHFLHDAVGKRGGNKFLVEMVLVEDVYEKIMNTKKVNNLQNSKALVFKKQNSKK